MAERETVKVSEPHPTSCGVRGGVRPLSIPKTSPRTDPRNAHHYHHHQKQEELGEDASGPDIMTELGARWKALSDAEKAPYIKVRPLALRVGCGLGVGKVPG
jgi:hypothetical protein